MFYLFGTVIVFCLMVVLSFHYAHLPISYVEKRVMRESSRDELYTKLIEETKGMRTYELGNYGIRCDMLYRKINLANRMIKRKIKEEKPISDAERWLYENFYLVYRFVFSIKNNMSELPGINGEPRIVKIARIIVDNSCSDLVADRIKFLLEKSKKAISFTYDEIKEFNNALGYAIIEQVYIFAERLLYDERCKKEANSRRINLRNFSKDVYLYYLLQRPVLDDKAKLMLEKRGIDERSVKINYNIVSMRNIKMAESLFSALRQLNECVPVRVGIKYMGAYNVISKIFDLENISTGTLCDYFSKIDRISKKCRVSEEFAAKKIMEFCEQTRKDISIVVFDNEIAVKRYISHGEIKKIHTDKNVAEFFYTIGITLVAITSALITGLFIGNVFYGIVSFIPFFFISENIINFFLSYLKCGVDTPAMNYKNVPYEHSLMIVISEYITSMDHLKEAIEHAQGVINGNRDDNVSMGLLIDTKGGEVPVSALDNEIIDYLEQTDLGENINIFFRKKSYIGNKFIAKERKRGAIMALAKLLITHEDFEFLYINNKEFVTPKYILTLDSDNTMLPGEAIRMVNMMAHPYNYKYDILAMRGRNNLYSIRNRYSSRYLSESGFETYPNFTGLYFNLFRREIFCGKGIFRLERFYNKLEEILPSKKILSHDILEGCILNTGNGGLTFEDAPDNFISDRDRKRRWQRGDIQLLPFILGLWKNDDRKRCKSYISPLGKYVIGKNIIGIIKETCLFSMLLIGLLMSPMWLWWSLGIFLLPYIINQIKILRGIVSGSTISAILKRTLENIRTVLFDFIMLGYYAVDNLIILFSTLIKMVLKKNLLEWKTYYTAQTDNSLSLYVKEFAFPSLIHTFICGILFVFNMGIIFYATYILIAMFGYFLLYAETKSLLKEKDITYKDKKKLENIAKNTYKYFCYMRNDGGLIGDNLQIKPYKGIAKNTSPTNIGFSIYAELCAKELGIISLSECVSNIKKILSAIIDLEKWNGNLYNWYDIDTHKPVTNFVSSVDNGNLAAILLLTSAYMRDNGCMDTALIADKLFAEMKIDKLYDKEKRLFFIGKNGDRETGYYDLLASEARILSFVYIALYGDYEHYACLQKDFVRNDGANTLLSWSGTMFEMLMPELFFVPPKGSMFYNSAKSTVKMQIKKSFNGVWGISESGYYAFDENMKYQYSAFGIKKLGLSSGTRENVISPYASVLALRYAPINVIHNLDKFISLGMMFEYGLCESIDFGKNGGMVCSAMSHHQGMIIASITNYLKNNVFTKLLAQDIRFRALIEYFNDVQPNVRIRSNEPHIIKKIVPAKNNYFVYADNWEQNYEAYGLTDTQYTVVCNVLGGGYSRIGQKFISKFSGLIEDSDGMFFFAQKHEGDYSSPTFLPFGDIRKKYTFSSSGTDISFSSDGLKEDIILIPSAAGEVRKLSADIDYEKVVFFCDICLDHKDAFDSHPYFRNLFISIRQIAENIIIIAKRMPGQKGKSCYIAVRVEGIRNIKWECNRLNFIGNGNNLACADFLNNKFNKNFSSLGDVLNPCIGFIGEFCPEKKECQVCLLYAEDENVLEQTVLSLPNDIYCYALNSVQNVVLSEKTQHLLGPIIYAPIPQNKLRNIVESGKIDMYKQHSNLLKVLQYSFDTNSPEQIVDFIDTILQVRAMGISIMPVVYSNSGLSEINEKFIRNTFAKNHINDYKIIYELSDEKYFSFLNIDSDLSYKKIPIILSKSFYADRNRYNLISSSSGEVPHISFLTGKGGFDSFGRYIVNGTTLMPYTNVIGHKYGGVITTTQGNGFYYFDNSRENKAIRFDNSPLGIGGEKVYIKTLNHIYDIGIGYSANCYTVIDKGRTLNYYFCDVFSAVTTSTVICEGKVRLLEIKINKKEEYLEFLYCFYPSAGWKYSPINVSFSQISDLIRIYNLENNHEFYVKILGIKKENLTLMPDNEPIPYFEYYCEKNDEKIIITASQDIGLLNSLNENNIDILMSKTENYFKSIDNICITSSSKSMDYIVSFLPYQILSSRLNARAGFYQVGGAIGFRDQIQDSLAFFSKPEIIKERIIEGCLHQYEEGDVMHWWHEPKFGLRTRITDDKLFLPYAIIKYIEYTSDKSILDEKYPYLHSEILLPEEKDRFENPPYTTYKESVFNHCLRAIRSALKYGEHKLLIMGKGDWNDGMDEICANGVGESVFNSMFAYMILRDFSNLCEDGLSKEMNAIAIELKKAINLYAFEEDRYKRLYSDDGRWLGSTRSNVLKLDLLVQAFGVISGVADGERAMICLRTAEQLIDRDAGIIKLLDPPLTNNNYIGYISDYPKGVRENGGQYTHATIWYLIALTMVGKQDFAFELFQMINPVEKCRDKEKNDRYKCEPYVMCGDVYSNEDNYGQGGWSWYTGSAGWAYKLITEYFYGLKKRGDELFIEPSLPKKLKGSIVVYRYGNSTYNIEYKEGLLKKIYVDGDLCDKVKLEENVRKKIVVEV